MAQKTDRDVGIIIDLLVDANKFTTDISAALKNGVTVAKDSANKIQDILNRALSLKQVTGDLTGVENGFKRLLTTVEQFREGSQMAYNLGSDMSEGLSTVVVSADKLSAAWLRIQEQAKSTHRSATEAAVTLVRNNELEIGTAQAALEANKKKLMSVKQIDLAMDELARKAVKLNDSLSAGLNITPVIEKDIQALAKLKAQIIAGEEYFTMLANAQGGTWKSNTAAVIQPNASLGKQLNTKANALGVRPQDVAIEMGQAGQASITELQAGLAAAGPSTEAFLLSSKEVTTILTAQKKALQEGTVELSKFTLAEKEAALAAEQLAQAEREAQVKKTETTANAQMVPQFEAEIAKRKEIAIAAEQERQAQAKFNAEYAKSIEAVDKWEAKTTAAQARYDAKLAEETAAQQRATEAANARKLAEVNAANEAAAAEQRNAQYAAANAKARAQYAAEVQKKTQEYVNKLAEEQKILQSVTGNQNNTNKAYQTTYNLLAKILGLKPAQNMAPDPRAFELFTRKIRENQAELERLKNSSLGWAEASRKAITDNAIAAANAGKIIQNIASQLGTSVQTAAQVAIASGQVSVGNAQNYLANSGKNLAMSQQQVTTAVQVQTAAVNGNKVAVQGLTGVYSQVVQGNKAAANAVNGFSGVVKNMKGGLQSAVDGITKVMGQLLLLQYILMPVTEAIQKATEAYLELSKAQFALQSGVKATQSQIGATAGTYQQWEATIKRLANEFPQFSEVSITRGIANITKLQASLGFTQKKMEDLIDAGVALAQMSGEDLGAALQDVVQALGGSSVVLDKYGIFIRDADKNQSELAKTIGKSTDQMTSQELALATLEAIINKTNPLLASMGDYSNTMGGKIAIANANIEESYASLGEVTSQFDLYFKNLYSNLLESVTKALPLFQGLLLAIQNINNATATQEKNKSIIDENKLSPFNRYQIEKNKSDQEILDLQRRSSYLYTNPMPGLTENANDFGALNLQTSKEKVKEYKDLANEIEAINEKIRKEKERGGITGDWEKTRDDLVNKLNTNYVDTQRFLEYSTHFIQMLFPDLKGPAFTAKLNEFRTDYLNTLKEIYDIQHPVKTGGKSPDERDEESGAVLPIDPKVLDTLRKYYQEGIDISNQYNDDLADIRNKRTQADRDANAEEQRDRRDAENDRKKDIAKNIRDAEFDRVKALFKYNNDLANIDEEARKDKKAKEQEYQDKTIEAWEDYYKELRLLDQEYLFDLRDAVADNDAVAIKRLERKYNLDKNKINEKLQDRLSTEQKGLDKSIAQIDQDVKEKKDKLARSYEEELALIQLNLDHQNDEVEIKYNEQLETIKTKLQDKKDAIEQNFKDEMALQELHYDNKMRDLGIKLGQEEKAVLDHLDLLLDDYKKFFGDDGEILSLMRGFYGEQKALSTSAIAEQSGYKDILSDPAFQKYFKDTFGIDVSSLKPIKSAPTNLHSQPFAPVEFSDEGVNAPIKVMFSSDGTIPEQFYDIISNRTIEEITNTLGKMIAK